MKLILGIVALLIAGFVAFVATRPSTYHIVRSTTISAPPQVVMAKIDNLKEWEKWSPWYGRDPQMKQTYAGPASGVGADYQWSGNDKVGAGRMTITSERAPGNVEIRLEFIKPFASVCSTAFALSPEGPATKVTWSMDGTNNFLAKAMCLFMDMDKAVGGDFEKGLAKLKTECEGGAPTPAT